VTVPGLRGGNFDAFFAIAYIGLFTFAVRVAGSRASHACLALALALGLFAWAWSLRRARTIAELPTSRIGSAAQGYVELQGTSCVEREHLIWSPLSNTPCIWYRYRIYSRDNSKKEWRQIDSGVSQSTFDIRDGTGSCCVDPEFAEVITRDKKVAYRDERKLEEEFLFNSSPIYVLGEFSTIGGAATVLSVSEDVSDLLGSWKQDPVALKRRFDLNRDGEIDLQEWEQARRLATRMVEQQHREIRSQSGVHMIRAPQDGRMFLVSSLPPHSLRRRYLLFAAMHLAVTMVAVVLLLRL
jgi:hypothetical protein